MFLYIFYAQIDVKFHRERVLIFVYSKAVNMGREPLAEPFGMGGMETAECVVLSRWAWSRLGVESWSRGVGGCEVSGCGFGV